MTTIEVHGLATRCVLHLVGRRSDELADAVGAAWSRCLTARGAERDGTPLTVALLAADEEAPENADVSGTDLGQVLQSLTQAITYANIAAQTGRLFMLHAGAVADPRTGRALVYVARGGTGKTTLTRQLGAHLSYLTDETAGFTADGVLHPYPKPLSVRAAGNTGLKDEISPDALDLRPTIDGARLHQLVLLDRRNSLDGPPHVTPLDTITALATLAPESSALSSLPRPLQTLAGFLESGRPALRLTYHEASEVLDDLRALVEA